MPIIPLPPVPVIPPIPPKPPIPSKNNSNKPNKPNSGQACILHTIGRSDIEGVVLYYFDDDSAIEHVAFDIGNGIRYIRPSDQIDKG